MRARESFREQRAHCACAHTSAIRDIIVVCSLIYWPTCYKNIPLSVLYALARASTYLVVTKCTIGEYTYSGLYTHDTMYLYRINVSCSTPIFVWSILDRLKYTPRVSYIQALDNKNTSDSQDHGWVVGYVVNFRVECTSYIAFTKSSTGIPVMVRSVCRCRTSYTLRIRFKNPFS